MIRKEIGNSGKMDLMMVDMADFRSAIRHLACVHSTLVSLLPCGKAILRHEHPQKHRYKGPVMHK